MANYNHEDIELVNYVNQSTMPHYLLNDLPHRLKHRDTTTYRAQLFALQASEPVQKKSVFILGMYHDIGHHINQREHEAISAQMCADDKGLRKFSSYNEIIAIAQGIADHRSSNPNEPRNLLGKIIRTADHRTSIEDYLVETYAYHLQKNPKASEFETIEDVWDYTNKKHGKNGYAHRSVYFQDLEFEDFSRRMETLLADKKVFVAALLNAIPHYNSNSKYSLENLV